ncbi:diaminopropionate ammonia-lyase [Palleronia caenipelagi]|uniref:Diaminopropionate ammonia-lyase n=1 Tax=Palleronia caenipelagi TaxID=2489174 RepID=A0A547PIU8_9RHOB|nr:diaminopropionate ammonia-lyase [Palleronia caenipelagi]TRD14086.1 diaminopropionate ammonia-lyase [Palleronia caenipelagi]
MLLENDRQTAPPARRGFRVSPDRPLTLLGSCPAYTATPLTERPDLAHQTGIERLWIKDETQRMGLGSFKALGGAYAVAQMILDRSDEPDPTTATAKAVAGQMTFVTASAGNHGLSVAAGARVFGAGSRILLSTTVPEAFADRIRALGAGVIRVDGSYEDSVTEAARLADAEGWIHLADGSWEGYLTAPALVMEGYTVLPHECSCGFQELGAWPDHVLLQAGVGGLAAAVAAHIRAYWPVQPEITVVEPDAAPCLMESVRASCLTEVSGPVSDMGRLDCKNASLLAWESLRADANRFVTISEAQATEAVECLARAGLASTPSGVAGFAALTALDLPEAANCMVILSEGPEVA